MCFITAYEINKRITDEGVISLSSLCKLEELRLPNAAITGKVFEHLTSLKSLHVQVGGRSNDFIVPIAKNCLELVSLDINSKLLYHIAYSKNFF